MAGRELIRGFAPSPPEKVPPTPQTYRPNLNGHIASDNQYRHFVPVRFSELVQNFPRTSLYGSLAYPGVVAPAPASDGYFKKPVVPVRRPAGGSRPHHRPLTNMDNALLHSMNYSDADMQDEAFDVTSNLNMDDSLLATANSINTPSSSFDLFEGANQISEYNMEPQQLSPHHFTDSTGATFDMDDDDSSSSKCCLYMPSDLL